MLLRKATQDELTYIAKREHIVFRLMPCLNADIVSETYGVGPPFEIKEEMSHQQREVSIPYFVLNAALLIRKYNCEKKQRRDEFRDVIQKPQQSCTLRTTYMLILRSSMGSRVASSQVSVAFSQRSEQSIILSP